MPMIILIIVVVVGLVALALFRTKALRDDRRRQEQDSNR